jgi:hypothetical protein
MRFHTLPAEKSAEQLWPAAADTGEDFTAQGAYQKLLKDGSLDQCGVTLLAGKAVGAPFVGTVAAALAVSEVLRHLHDGVMHQVIDLDLAAVGHQQVVLQTRTSQDSIPVMWASDNRNGRRSSRASKLDRYAGIAIWPASGFLE